MRLGLKALGLDADTDSGSLAGVYLSSWIPARDILFKVEHVRIRQSHCRKGTILIGVLHMDRSA